MGSDKETTPRGSMRDKKGSRISVGLAGAFDPLKVRPFNLNDSFYCCLSLTISLQNLGHSVSDHIGGPRPDPEFIVVFVEDERNFVCDRFFFFQIDLIDRFLDLCLQAPFKFEGTLTVGEVVRRLCAQRPAKHAVATEFGLCMHTLLIRSICS